MYKNVIFVQFKFIAHALRIIDFLFTSALSDGIIYFMNFVYMFQLKGIIPAPVVSSHV
jgi:hypothetical protein